MSFTLVIGNKNYSSWSMRPWLALRQAGIAFDEIVIPLYEPGSKERILEHSPAGKVPVLRDGGAAIWDSLAIIEYVAEKFPDAHLWPAASEARALARSISAEMHSGFVPLRKHLMMNIRRRVPGFEIPSEAQDNITRIEEIWSSTRAKFGQGGPFLFGAFTAADAMYAPVVTRLVTYDAKVSDESLAYMEAVLSLPAMRDWAAAAEAEEWTIPGFEV